MLFEYADLKQNIVETAGSTPADHHEKYYAIYVYVR